MGKLSNLHGSLEIKKLENVTSIIEVSEARMMDKKYLNRLRFHWSRGDDFTNSQSEMEILDKLEPHQNLENLEIKGYRGTKFPEWVGHPSFHNMTNLTLSRCNNCCMLPCLGQLPSLKELAIRELNGVEIITTDFFKKDDSSFSGTPFPALEDLEFRGMACWKIKNCSSATSFPGNCLPTSLKRLSIKKFRKLQFPKQNQHQLLESLVIVSSCDSLKSFPLESFPNLGDLIFFKCENLERLSVSESPLQNLCIFEVRNCPSFVSFPEGGLPAPSLTLFIVSKGVPPSLRSLDIRNCDKLLRSPSLGSMDMLTDLYIGGPCVCGDVGVQGASPPHLPPKINNQRMSSWRMWREKEKREKERKAACVSYQTQNLECPSGRTVQQEAPPTAVMIVAEHSMEGTPNWMAQRYVLTLLYSDGLLLS
ncbi:Leucine-rich repeat domain superfamily [Sesbania bispinosa]|nr:Leucine-rich repeat domain superfamily [Sesbania bispinosa]